MKSESIILIGMAGVGKSTIGMSLAKALGFDLLSVVDALYRDGYGPKGSLWQTIKASEGLTPIEGPNSIDTRYLKEDTPNGFVTWSNFGNLLNVKTPIIDSLINIVSVIYDIDYFKEGRTLKRLGLHGMNTSEMLYYVTEGSIRRPTSP